MTEIRAWSGMPFLRVGISFWFIGGSMIFSKNRYPRFGIVLEDAAHGLT